MQLTMEPQKPSRATCWLHRLLATFLTAGRFHYFALMIQGWVLA